LREHLEIANHNIDRLARIINDFLDVARLEAGKVQLAVTRVPIGTVIREVIEEFTSIATPKNITIDTVLPNINTIIEAERDKLTQILTNLIGNAIKYIRPGDHILVTLDDRKDEVSISVHDNGPGIEPKYLNNIFDRFTLGATSTRSGQPSTGLGLTIAKELVELHHGHIWVESVVGQGSTFSFVLPKRQTLKN
jgi:signal transduction histidine kinase